MPKGGGEDILLVDDDELVLHAVGNMLGQLGYTVTMKTDPLEALDILQQRPNAFEAMLTDFTMPRMTGLQLAERARDLRPDLPVVLMTGKSDLIETVDLVSIGKPFRTSDLASCLKDAI